MRGWLMSTSLYGIPEGYSEVIRMSEKVNYAKQNYQGATYVEIYPF